MQAVSSNFYAKIALSALLVGLSAHAQDSGQNVDYFNGKENRSMSVHATSFAPTHPDCCSEKKIEAVPAPVIVKAEKDSDGDSVVDSKDECPNTPKGYQVDTKGCPSSVTLHINFDFASNIIPASSDNDVLELTQFMQNNPASTITIVGHTDNIGIDARNQPRSEARAKALGEKLIANGIDANRIVTSGKGSHEPIATNDTDAGRAQNRRIEIEIR
jgi:outer membrane protein OmpA-like peptidoglycan-associated protein